MQNVSSVMIIRHGTQNKEIDFVPTIDSDEYKLATLSYVRLVTMLSVFITSSDIVLNA